MMANGTQKAASLREPACMFCGRLDVDLGITGNKYVLKGIYFHTFCVTFSSGLLQRGRDGNAHFCSQDLIRMMRQAKQKLCFVCGSSGATITCADPDCERTFHLPCAYEGQCVTQYFGEFRAFCWEHRPQQAVQAAPEPDTTCIICLEPVDESRSYGTMVCPACQHAWFHRACIQRMALCSGFCFQCPNCRDRHIFLHDLLTVGIRIPDRSPMWEENSAYASLGRRHRRCDASECCYTQGREQAEEAGPWELLLCSSCAARGTHRLCSNLSHGTTSWQCDSCAGEGTGSSTN